VVRMSGDLEFPLLFTAYAELLPDALDPANTNMDPVLRQVVLEPLFFHHRVPGSDSLAKYAAAFFRMSRSIFTIASSFLVLASSISTSVNGR